jgi:hypothetical protein
VLPLENVDIQAKLILMALDDVKGGFASNRATRRPIELQPFAGRVPC